jgi:maltooligosyltrehalose trehalohydrolase
LHRDLLVLRREVFNDGRPEIDGAPLDDDAWVLRYFGTDADDDLLLIVNLGHDQVLPTIAEPLLAPVEGRSWRLRWSSQDPRYGGIGTPEPIVDGAWRIAGQTAIVLVPGDAAL